MIYFRVTVPPGLGPGWTEWARARLVFIVNVVFCFLGFFFSFSITVRPRRAAWRLDTDVTDEGTPHPAPQVAVTVSSTVFLSCALHPWDCLVFKKKRQNWNFFSHLSYHRAQPATCLDL